MFMYLFSSDPVPLDIKCIQLTSFGSSKNMETVRVRLPLPMRNEVLIRTYSWYGHLNS